MDSAPGIELDAERALSAASELSALADELRAAATRIATVPLPPTDRTGTAGSRRDESARGLGRLSAELATTALDLRTHVERLTRRDRDAAAQLRAISAPARPHRDTGRAEPAAARSPLAPAAPGVAGALGGGSEPRTDPSRVLGALRRALDGTEDARGQVGPR